MVSLDSVFPLLSPLLVWVFSALAEVSWSIVSVGINGILEQLQRTMRRHEEISQANSSALQLLSNKFQEFEALAFSVETNEQNGSIIPAHEGTGVPSTLCFSFN